ncbi:MAG: substrate-binding domain-containing protein [Streptosporangiales bacterium]|nr:substrate-binding domain-containing protein [Streptosporangiales bacterium]
MRLGDKRPVRLAALGGAALLVLAAGCGTSRDVGGGGQAQKCAGADTSAAANAKVWDDAAKAAGLEGLKPPKQDNCMVDTAQYKKDGSNNGRVTIGFASQGPTNSWALTYDEAFKARAKERGAQVNYASANGDAATQVNNVQDLLAQKPDVLVVTPMGSAVTGQIRQAAQQKVPVVLCTGKLPETPGVVSTVGRSYDLQGTVWAEWIAKKLNGKGKIAMLSGIAGVPTAEYQYQAAKKVFETKYPDIEIAAHEYTNWSPTEAKKVAAKLVVRHPDLDAIWSDSAISDVGVVEAYKEAGRPIPPVTGDSSNAFLRVAKDNKVEFALSAYAPEQSADCVDVAMDVVAGKSVPKIKEIAGAVFTDKELAKYYREDCTDNLWVPSKLSDEQLKALKLC